MSIATVSNTIASQYEHVEKEEEELYLNNGPLWKRMDADKQVQQISGRPARQTYEVLSGAKMRVGNFDGASLGRGSGPTQVYGELSSVYYTQASEYTALADYTTDSDEKAIKSYVALTKQRAAETVGMYMDCFMTYGDGANTIGVVQGTTGANGILVDNANRFVSNQDIDIWTNYAPGGTYVGTVTIQTNDIQNNTIWLTGPFPGGTVAGYLLMVSGSLAMVGTGMYGLNYYHAFGSTGNYQGIQKSAFPGFFTTPGFALNGTLTPAAGRALEAQIRLAIGSEKADESNLFFHTGVDVQAAWENTALNVQHVVVNENRRDVAADMLPKKAPTLMGGREIVANERAQTGRIDGIGRKYWGRVETKKLSLYEVGGQTVFPTYGADGGVATSIVFYYVVGFQINQRNPRADCLMTGVTIPHLYFGK